MMMMFCFDYAGIQSMATYIVYLKYIYIYIYIVIYSYILYIAGTHVLNGF